MQMLTCRRCGHERPETDFYRSAKTRSGRDSVCRPCRAEDRAKNARRVLSVGFPDEMKCSCCGEVKSSGEFHMNLAAPRGLQARCRDCEKKYYLENKDRKLAKSAEYKRAREARDPGYRLRSRLSSALSIFVRGALIGPRKSYRAIGRHLGIGEAEFVAHLVGQFKPGMTRENYGKVWELDHVCKVADFDHCDPAQVAKCWHYSNIRPEFKQPNSARKPYRGPHDFRP